MEDRTIRRWDGNKGTRYAIDITENGRIKLAGDYSHADAVAELEACGITDAEAVVYNASQSRRAVEF